MNKAKFLSVVLSAFTLAILSVSPASAWKTQQSAGAFCSESNRAVISWSFTNTEPNQQKYSMDVVATDLASGKSSAKVTATPGQTVTGTIEPGDKNVGEGNVKFELTWTDGRDGIDSRKASYDSTNCVDETKQIEVCRDGKIVAINENERKDSDTNPPCPEETIEVCRDGEIITINPDDRRDTDTDGCVEGETDMPKELPNTGVGSVLGGVAGFSALGLSARNWLESRAMLRSGVLRKDQ